MNSFICEDTKVLDCKNINEFYSDVVHLVNKVEPSLNKDEVVKLIRSRDELGNGLVSENVLIVHVISNKIKNNRGIYCYLNNSVLWKSSFDDISANVNRAVILMVSPLLKNGKLMNLENFVNNEDIDNLKESIVRKNNVN